MNPWRRGPLKYWLELNDSGVWGEDPTGQDDVPVVRSTDIRLDGSWSLENVAQRSVSIVERVAKRLALGDLVVVKSSGSADHLGKTAIVDNRTAALRPCFANFVQRLRPTPTADSRYVWYVLNSRQVATQMEVLGNTTTGLRNLNGSIIGSVTFPGPPLDAQRAIADYLDAEIDRIDDLIAKKRGLIALTQERVDQSMSAVLAEYGFNFPCEMAPDWKTVPVPFGWRVVRLSQVLVQLTNGYVGPTRNILVDSGVRYIQSLHIKDGEINFNRRPFYVSCDWHSARPRIHLRAGDVLIVQTGDIGKVAVVPESFGHASCHALQIARVRRDMLSGAFLAEYLRTPFGYGSLLSRATGALHPHLEGGIRDVPIILPPKEIQTVILRRIGDEREHQKKLESHLVRQIQLLQERRQAFITAVVTGEMDVPGVSS